MGKFIVKLFGYAGIAIILACVLGMVGTLVSEAAQ